MEHPHDDRRNTTAHPTDHNPQTVADWKDWGKRAVLGIHEYFGVIGAPNLIIDNIMVDNKGCTVYANDTYANGTAYYVPVNVTVENVGIAASGSFNVSLTVYWINGSLQEDYVEWRVLGLASGENTTLTYSWRPTHTGYYNLTAVVDCDSEVSESNEGDNTLVLSEFPVALIGDVNGDGTVGIVDAVIVSLAWASHPGDPNWNLCADLNHDSVVNIGDGVRICLNWAKSW